MSEEAKVTGTEPGTEDKGPDAIWQELDEAERDLGESPPHEATEAQPKDEAAAPKDEAPAKEPPASQETPDDLWAKADPKLREAFEAERTERQRVQTLATRLSGRASKADHELNALRAKLTQVGTATPPGEEATDREERRKQLIEEYGDSAGKLVPDIIALEEQVRALREAQQTEVSAQTEELLQTQLVTLEGAHPDWADVVGVQVGNNRVPNPAFAGWLEKQPGYVRDTIAANAEQIIDGASCADIITRYKAETAPKEDPAKKAHEDKRKEQLEGLRDTTTKAPPLTATGPEDRLSLWNEFDAADRRAAAGR